MSTFKKVDLDCFLSNCKGIQYLSFYQCSVSLPKDMSINIQQLNLYGRHDFDPINVADTLCFCSKLDSSLFNGAS